jgi:hypothetical protein
MSKGRSYLLVIFFTLFSSFLYGSTVVVPKHNFYLSICEIVYKKSTGTLQISLRFFTDDLEKAILNYNHVSIISKSGKKAQESDQNLFNYLKDNFSIYQNEQNKTNYNFIGWEIEEGVVWCYLEASIQPFNKLRVESKLLTEIFSSQKNLVYLKSGNNETSVLLDRSKTTDILAIE